MAKRKEKFPLAWHEECLRNSTENFEKAQAKVKMLSEDLERWSAQLAFKQEQIDAAKARGVDAFAVDAKPKNIR
jgi:hypothetical protein